jgi:undecaprenyl diphosphate synthase
LFEVILQEVDFFLTNRKFSKEVDVILADVDYHHHQAPHSGVENLKVNFVVTESERFPKEIKEKIESFDQKFKEFGGGEDSQNKKTLNLCISYTGKSEIVEAVNKLIKSNREINSENIESELLFKSSPDLVIRTSGEQRLSGFLTWQTSYSEFMFLNKHWPEVSADDLDECILNFKRRNRRFGK